MRFKVYLREVAEFQKGFAFKSKDYVDKGTKIVKVSNLTADSIDISQCVCIENNLAKKYITKYDLNLKDIIITTVGSWPTNPASVVGKVVRVPKIAENTLLNQNAVRVRGNERVIQDYLYYLLKDKSFMSYIVGTAQGSANQASITQEDIKNFSFYLPPLEEQKAIADILSSLDEKIELNNQMNETLEEMAQALFKRWFVDFEFPNEEGQPYKSSGGEMVESELGMIPKGWFVEQIGNLATITRGASPRPIQEYMSEEGIPWVKISDATGAMSKYLTETKEFIKEEGRSKSREVTEGTLILSNSATPGIPKVMLIDACVHDGWLIFRDYKDTTIEFMYYMLLHEQKRILSLSNGSVFRNLKTDILKNYKIIVPSESVLLCFTELVNAINENIKINVLENNSLIETRDSLLPKLMSGEIRVSDLC